MRNGLKKFLLILEKLTYGKINARRLKIGIKKFLDISLFEQIIFFSIDLLFFPFTLLSALFLRFTRSFGIKYLILSKWLFERIGLYPIIDHYYEPLFQPKYIKEPLESNRILKSIDFNIKEQLWIIKQFHYNQELIQFPIVTKNPLEFSYDEGSYPRGDSEYYYNIIRYYKPRKIIEIGSGQSTLMAHNAIEMNLKEDDNYLCDLICIEPFEQYWLERLSNVTIIRKKVENIDISFFEQLTRNDILFIDSSHIIRPQGDVLFEFTQILPILKSGVLIHFHDIFTPKDYPEEWIIKSKLFWNEQYLLESFLSYNNKFKIIGSLNYLANNYPSDFLEKTPMLKLKLKGCRADYALGSMWLQSL
jgi:hypothetical protein